MQQHLAYSDGGVHGIAVKKDLPRMLEARKFSYQMYSSAASGIRVQAIITAAEIS
jgi:hypothetical protein